MLPSDYIPLKSEIIELESKYSDTICKEIVSFLNADGGQILIGVDNDAAPS